MAFWLAQISTLILAHSYFYTAQVVLASQKAGPEEKMATGADFLAQDIHVDMAIDGRNVILTLLLGDTTCSVELPRERLENLCERITRTLAESAPSSAD